jgi:hypothetical protein
MKPALKLICLPLLILITVTVSGCGVPKNEAPANLEIGVSGIAALADRYIQSGVELMEVLAVSPEVQSTEWDAMLPMLAEADRNLIPAVRWFALADGSYHVVGLGKTANNIADRAYFSILLAGENAIGELVVSRSTGKKVLVTAVPVIKDGEVIAALGTSIYLEALNAAISEQIKLPEGMVFYAVTPAGELALHTDAALILEATPEELDNAVFATSDLTGWRFALGYKK